MSSTLPLKHCDTKAPKLSDPEIAALLLQVPGWSIESNQLSRTFNFRNYYESLAFVNATAWISHGQDHHPDIALGYNAVTMRYSSHSAGGLTENDFICAAKVSALLTV